MSTNGSDSVAHVVVVTKPARPWVFTLNNPTTLEAANLSAQLDALLLSKELRYAVIGEEIAPTTRTRHFQGYLYFTNNHSFNTVKTLVGTRAHVEIARGTPAENQAYCTKESTWKCIGTLPQKGARMDLHAVIADINSGQSFDDVFVDNPEVAARYPGFVHHAIDMFRRNNAPAQQLILYPWQHSILDMIESTPGHLSDAVPDRDIIWIWSVASSTGKTTFLRYLHSRYPGQVLTINDHRHNEVLNAIHDRVKVICFNLDRASGADKDVTLRAFCSMLEKLSDRGVQRSTKYQGRDVYLHDVWIFVTANIKPPTAFPKAWLPNRCREIEATNVLPTNQDAAPSVSSPVIVPSPIIIDSDPWESQDLFVATPANGSEPEPEVNLGFQEQPHQPSPVLVMTVSTMPEDSPPMIRKRRARVLTPSPTPTPTPERPSFTIPGSPPTTQDVDWIEKDLIERHYLCIQPNRCDERNPEECKIAQRLMFKSQ